ncbi:nonsense-mediated decay protein Upf2 [Schizosaccharomyces pombe]|uniref:Nonsense-mediated mRNA decay protein 2 n=1 Tax=Schizosaccharomyces pombe (strain 972 / ATCC 24843) TaxID=284812 RepID=NMD2_SCHPO|nr:nonsense-mediated decay protein Upf2 [Schizosaccharomyces pombe]O13824.1 RecName: Full=Nonsense-mediated mRNA decay protein 2; AltName: Full=Up-frameshift suppressor 2 [Schizosaccharomyces pombe 972h-]AAG33226.1 Upf2p-like protein [Schizosaccharomyces pombe]CAB11644.1 nonsense-mediated decay protein Upf2 [Schizosaccharomyces pombe]|eukprot:NP_593784.1 nonsense-mediated decay protein Upf2 [Schizosaccharomyces pombe]
MSREEQIKKLNQYLDNRELAFRAKDGDKNIFHTESQLDSSLKKNTAFMKRCKSSLTSENYDSFIKEIKTLSLKKFIPEITAAIVEGMMKCKATKDILSSVKIVWALNLRFSTAFTGPMLANLYCALYPNPGYSLCHESYFELKQNENEVSEKDRSSHLLKVRPLLRFLIEFWLNGVVGTPEDFVSYLPSTDSNDKKFRKPWFEEQNLKKPLVVLLFNDLMDTRFGFLLLPVLTSLVRTFSCELFTTEDFEDKETLELVNRLNPVVWRTYLRKSLNSYVDKLEVYCQKRKSLFEELNKQYQEQSIIRADPNNEKFQRLANFSKSIESEFSSYASLSEVLNRKASEDLLELNFMEKASSGTNSVFNASGERSESANVETAQVWDDREQYFFYEVFPNFNEGSIAEMKSSIYESSQEGIRSSSENNKKEDDLKDSTGDLNTTQVSSRVDNFLLKLPSMVSLELTNEMALEFYDLNTKASRNRLIKALCTIPRTSSFLVPYYVRLARILSQLSSEFSTSLVDHARHSFKRMIHRKAKHEYDTRLLIVRYISELTKFQLMPFHMVFECYKLCINEFTPFDLEVLALLLESCGRFLLRYPETKLQMQSFLEAIQKKKLASALASQDQLVLENALHFVNPPKRGIIVSKKKSLKEEFLYDLIQIRLKDDNVFPTLLLLRKFDWKDDYQILYNTIMEVWNIKYNSLNALARLLSALYKFHPEFCIHVIDDTLESLFSAVNNSDHVEKQKRLAQARFISELCVIHMLDVRAITNFLFHLLPLEKFESFLTMKASTLTNINNDMFRLRLIVVVLQTCGPSIIRSKTKKTMLTYLLAYQCYFLIQPEMPLDMLYEFEDVIGYVRPSMKVYMHYEEARNALTERLQAISDDWEEDDTRPVFQGANDGDISSNEESVYLPEDISDESETDEESSGLEESDLLDSEDEDIDNEMQLSRELDEEFERLTNESLLTRMHEKNPGFDVPLPLRASSLGSPYVTRNEESASESSHVMFTLLTKRGNKQRSQYLEIPSHSSLVRSTKNQQTEEIMERKRVKEMVLNFE